MQMFQTELVGTTEPFLLVAKLTKCASCRTITMQQIVKMVLCCDAKSNNYLDKVIR